MSGRRASWDDDRLDAAFAARATAAPSTPPDLAATIAERLRASGGSRGPFGYLAAVAGVTAAIAIAIAVVVGADLRDSGPTSSPGAPSGSSSPSIAGGPSSSPARLSAMTVGAAIQIRDGLPDDREIRVTGWLRGGVPIPCPAPMPPFNPTQLVCPQALPSIVGSVADSGVGRLNELPAGPAIQPSFALVDSVHLPPLMFGSPSPPGPIEITITGHFHDRRATLCSEAPDCASTFIVDRIDSIGGIDQPTTTSYGMNIEVERGNTTSGIEIPPTMIAVDLDADVAPLGSSLTILSRRVMSIDGLLDAEPSLAAGWSAIGTARDVASITALDPGDGAHPARARTYLVPDGSAAFFEMTATGPVVAGDLSAQVFPNGLIGRVGEPIPVSQAIDHRDHALDDSELLVSGFGWEPGPIFCSLVRPSMPVLDQCPSGSTWLTDRDPATRAQMIRPKGGAINLVIPPESVNLARLTTTPAPIVVLGHFDDHRAASCPTELVERCRRNFIVDAILDPDRIALDQGLATKVHPGPSSVPRGTATWAADAAGLPTADRADSLISVFPVAVAALGAFEPDTVGTEALSGVETVWLVHFIDSGGPGVPTVRTRIVTDATPGQGVPGVFDITEAGVSRAIPANP